VPRRAAGPPALSVIGVESVQVDDHRANGGDGDGGKQQAARSGGLVVEGEGCGEGVAKGEGAHVHRWREAKQSHGDQTTNHPKASNQGQCFWQPKTPCLTITRLRRCP